MKPIARTLFVCTLITCATSYANDPELLAAKKAYLEYLAANNAIAVRNGDNLEAAPLFLGGIHSIQALQWAIATGWGLGTGLSVKNTPNNNNAPASWLVAGQNGKPGVFFIDTRRVSCESVDNSNLVEILFDRDDSPPLKLCEGSAIKMAGVRACVAQANKSGGGFLRLRIKDNVIFDSSVCTWKEGQPSNHLFDPNAWQQTDNRIGISEGVQLFSDLFILDPSRQPIKFHSRFLTETFWVGEKDFIVTAAQRDAILALEREARERRMVIACSRELKDANPYEQRTRDYFCFVVDPDVLPGYARVDIMEDEFADNDASNTRGKLGRYQKLL